MNEWMMDWENERDEREEEILKQREIRNAPDLERFTLVELRLLLNRLQTEIDKRLTR